MVATSGAYSDLIGKPSIPTVNDAVLTIQQNGENVKTFSANASSNVTANITVPTKVSELTNDLGFLNNPITNNTTIGSLDYSSSIGTNLPTMNTLAYWNGAYSNTPNTTSNLAYCIKGEFGDIVTHNTSEFLTEHQTVTNSAPTLSWNTTSTIGSVGGTNLTVNMPSNPNTDTQMTQNVSTTNATYPVLLCPTANATSNQGAKSGLFASVVKVNPSTGMVTASGFTGNVIGNCSGSSGSCTGNATTATTATKATQDANGNVINTTYATKLENALKANDANVAHTTNNNIHVTSSDKSNWNNKSNFSG